MKRKLLLMTAFVVASAIVMAGVQKLFGLSSLNSLNGPSNEITIYVQSEEAPYLYVWTMDENTGEYPALNGDWPGTVMTEQEEVHGFTFWKQTIATTYSSINIIFSNSNGSQTADINGVTGDSYFIYDGASGYTDITAEIAALNPQEPVEHSDTVIVKTWDFSLGLSEETIANLNADTENWSGTTTDSLGNYIRWQNTQKLASPLLTANGIAIAETNGLLFDIGNYGSNSILIAYNCIRLTRNGTVITFPQMHNGDRISITGKSANNTATDRGLVPVQNHLKLVDGTTTDGQALFLGANVEGSLGRYTFTYEVQTESTSAVDVSFSIISGGIEFFKFEAEMNSVQEESAGQLADWTSTNHDSSTSSSNTWLFTSAEAAILRFDWSVSSESGCDVLRITLDGNQIIEASGEQSGTFEDNINGGGHVLIATYSKDGSVNNGSDEAKITNIQLGTLDEIINANITNVETVMSENKFVNLAVVDEANAYIEKIRSGDYDKSKAWDVVAQLQAYAARLAYIHLDINVATEGTMGDLVLESVENFTDVQSMKLSGKLNATDLESLKSRLTRLIELDMSGVNMADIPNELFSGRTMLKSIVLPSQLLGIGESSFNGCYNLADVSFPRTLKTIGRYAFYNCTSLTSVVFAEGLTSIGYQAFYCDEGGFYDNNGNWLQRTGSICELSLPGSLRTLDSYAFANQRNLRKVTFADGLKVIGSYAFSHCTGLSDLQLPATLTNIGSYAFNNCTLLKKVELFEGLTSTDYYAFGNCSSLQEVILPSTLQSVYYTFVDCSKLTKMTCKTIVPPSVNGYSVMGGNESQCTLTVPNLSVNVYKQTNYWDRFNIVGADILPDDITVYRDYRLNWPDSVSMSYKPNVYIGSAASLTVTGNSTLSASNFVMAYSANDARYNDYYDNDLQRWCYNRDNCYAALVNNANTRADNVRIDLYTRTNVWDFISMPFDIKVSDIQLQFEETPFVIRKYDGQKRAEGLNSQTWVNMTADSTLRAGQGYILQSASTSSDRNYNGFYLNAQQTVNKNNIFASSDVEVGLSYYESEFAHNRSWNLIGNPYPAYYDIRAMQTSAPITVWDAYNNNYLAYSPQDDSYILNPGQAFFVQRPVNEEKITFLKEGRQIDMTVRDIEYGSNRAASTVERSVFNVILTGNDMNDRTRFVINGAAKMDYESGRDASKFMSLETQSIQLYTMLSDVRYAINERPLTDGLIELGMQVCAEGTYTITLDTKAENEVYLIDRATGTETRIDGTEGYSFYAEKGIVEGRFAIRMGDGVVTGINAIDNSQQAVDNYYNMKGQRIVNPTKGLYIKNGKKMIVK